MTIRFVEPDDSAQILEIYKPFVLETSVSFETEIPSLEQFRKRIIEYASKSPWLVAELDGQVIGYAYATTHRSRQAYQWNQEVTVYTHPDYRRQQVAKLLYHKLLSYLQIMGFRKAIAIITLPNEPSVHFHKAIGFRPIGTFENVGYKFHSWHDTSWWDISLQKDFDDPKPLLSLEELKTRVNSE